MRHTDRVLVGGLWTRDGDRVDVDGADDERERGIDCRRDGQRDRIRNHDERAGLGERVGLRRPIANDAAARPLVRQRFGLRPYEPGPFGLHGVLLGLLESHGKRGVESELRRGVQSHTASRVSCSRLCDADSTRRLRGARMHAQVITSGIAPSFTANTCRCIALT
jgi:hypothetical protein